MGVVLQIRSFAIAEIEVLPMLSDPCIDVMMPDSIDEAIGVCVNEVRFAFEKLLCITS